MKYLVHQFLAESAQKHPEKQAAWFKEKWLTYGEIEAASDKLAGFLVKHGIQKGDRIAFLLHNSFEYIITYYAVLKAGAVTVALNTETTADSLKYLLQNSGAKGLISEKLFYKYTGKILDQLPGLQFFITQDETEKYETENLPVYNFDEILNSQSGLNLRSDIIDLDLASIVYTSGSTGKPKGVVLSHLNIRSNTESIVQYLSLTSEDRIMVILPFYYIYGKSLLNTHFYAGGSVVIDNRFVFPNAILETMKKTEATGFAGVPSTFTILLNKSAIHKYEFPRLRYVTQAGGAMAPAVQKQVAGTFDPAKLIIMYGATEASARLSYLDPAELQRKWGSIGKAIPNVELSILNSKGEKLGVEEVGEIAARGSNLMQGYWQDEDETANVLKNGYYYTGDLGKMDDEGFFFVVGRTKDMIKAGANRISAKEIEETILEHNSVHETAVIGVPDEILGEAIKAFLVLKANSNNTDEQEMLAFCKSKLPHNKVPKYFEFVSSLPKNPSGKILKNKLK